jgi:predicted ATPase
MPELDYISVKGFKSIGSIERLKLDPINVIIGANGSGKSNFIEVFSFLHAIREGRLQDYVARAGGANRLLHFGSKFTPLASIALSFDEQVNQYTIALAPTDEDDLIPVAETMSFWDKGRYPKPYEDALARIGKEAGISNQYASGVGYYVRNHLGSWRLYHFHDTSSKSPMKTVANLHDNVYLRPDGSNLAPFLYLLSQKHTESYELINRTVQRVAPFFDTFQLAPQRLNPDKIRLGWKHRNSDEYFDASSFSDGTLRFIALATLLLQPKTLRPSVILIDEPELGLHPYAITMLAAMVKGASVQTQVILSTQSPLLLDHFRPEDVLVADRVDGGTRLTRLESAALESWLNEYSLGQLWEKNELGGRPASE